MIVFCIESEMVIVSERSSEIDGKIALIESEIVIESERDRVVNLVVLIESEMVTVSD